jgi:hypothetical protein
MSKINSHVTTINTLTKKLESDMSQEMFDAWMSLDEDTRKEFLMQTYVKTCNSLA